MRLSEEEITKARESGARAARDLRAACNAVHAKQGGAGGAAICICGQGCGGSAPCSALATLRSNLRYGKIKVGDPHAAAFFEAFSEWLG